VANGRAPTKSPSSSRAGSESSDTAPPAREDSLIGLLFTSPPDQRDNLQQIKGIGPVMERKLNELGIYTLAQVMSWNSAAVEEVSRRLGVTGRIQRENWIEQARQLGSRQ
jgi:predicted flap endonuclease-1-like 5' DNA nuclease